MLSQQLNQPVVMGQDLGKSRASVRTTPVELARNPYVASLIVLVAVIAVTWALMAIETLTQNSRPYTIVYLIPVAIAAALMGLRGGYITAVVSIAFAYVLLFPHHLGTSYGDILKNVIEMSAMTVGTLTIATVVGRLRNALVDLDRLNHDLAVSEERRVSFNREVLLAVTGGRLVLCEAHDIRDMLTSIPDFSMQLSQPADASALRHHLQTIAELPRMDQIRWADLETSVTEAATNAIKHGNGGFANVWATPNEVAVLVADTGKGISPSELARATLERGYSSRYSLGMGFTMMLEAADTLALSTSSAGTMVLIRVGAGVRPSTEANLLARYEANFGGADCVTPQPAY